MTVDSQPHVCTCATGGDARHERIHPTARALDDESSSKWAVRLRYHLYLYLYLLPPTLLPSIPPLFGYDRLPPRNSRKQRR